jgi:hypothetical protein
VPGARGHSLLLPLLPRLQSVRLRLCLIQQGRPVPLLLLLAVLLLLPLAVHSRWLRLCAVAAQGVLLLVQLRARLAGLRLRHCAAQTCCLLTLLALLLLQWLQRMGLWLCCIRICQR